ncbi:MAG: hypothetical protein QM648_11005 [Solirubrobacterales bacterium]
MRKKLALLVTLSVLALSLVGAQSASASYLGVTVKPTEYLLCQPSPDSIGLLLGFRASVTAVGISKPKEIRIGYQVLTESKQVLRSGVLKLKRSKGYKADGDKPYVAYLGEKLTYHLNMSYTAGGKKRKKKKNYSATAPTQADIAYYGVTACS